MASKTSSAFDGVDLEDVGDQQLEAAEIHASVQTATRTATCCSTLQHTAPRFSTPKISANNN